MMPPIYISSAPDALTSFFSTHIPERNRFAGLIFILTTAGKAVVEIDGRTTVLQNGVLLTLLPSHLSLITERDREFQCLTLIFTFDSMADFPYMLQANISEKMEQTPCVSLNTGEQKKLESWHQAIRSHESQKEHPSYREILRSLLFIFTAEVCAIYSAKPVKTSATHGEELTDHFFRILHKHFRENRNVAFYASQLCITPKHLSKIISRQTGHIPSYWIANFTVGEAKMLLKSTNRTITQLSEELNFPNSSFFARYFKRHAGTSPLEYRLDKKIKKSSPLTTSSL